MEWSGNAYQQVVQIGYDNSYPGFSATYTPATSSYSPPGPIASIPAGASLVRSDYPSNGYNMGASSALYGAAGPGYNSYSSPNSSWEPQGRISPETYEEYVASPSPSDYVLEGSSKSFLQRPPPDYIAQQERDLPQLPTNLVVHE
ncbi:hypothetical protein BKA61DRAFT_684657 [Leptodontidium sp. MPI-SDFR-AT-0119]|nr:hypothetical protein BKA61DRAFT_684657 [Leptodontidium sp. MPI-SDFR-AT-0119]